MIFVDNANQTKPYINLAIEEHLLRNLETNDDILLFYINEPSIIIGRNQNTLEEINQTYVESKGIHITRRLSGGGAVYHDLGNLNFSFITNSSKDNVHNFRKFTEPVIQVLNGMDIPAELGGRNDILVDGRKVSGNAQYIVAKRMVSHGTLLFNSELGHLSDALNVKPGKIISKGIKSVRSRVANLIEFINEPITIHEFRDNLLHGIFNNGSSIPQYHLTQSDWNSINQLVQDRYLKWEWNYGHSPEFNVQRVFRFPIGELDARIDVQHGIIKNIKIYGDFLGLGDTSIIEHQLIGKRYFYPDLQNALQDMDVTEYFGNITNEEFLQFLLYA